MISKIQFLLLCALCLNGLSAIGQTLRGNISSNHILMSNYQLPSNFRMDFSLNVSSLLASNSSNVLNISRIDTSTNLLGSNAVEVQFQPTSKRLTVEVEEDRNSIFSFDIPFVFENNILSNVSIISFEEDVLAMVNSRTVLLKQTGIRSFGNVNVYVSRSSIAPSILNVRNLLIREVFENEVQEIISSSRKRLYRPYSGSRISAPDLVYYDGDEEECKIACDVTDSCIGFTLNKNTSGCQLKGRLDFLTYDNSGDTFLIDSFSENIYASYQNTNLQGSDLRNVSGDFASCKRQCDNDPQCTAFAFDSSSTINTPCSLKGRGNILSFDGTLTSYIQLNTISYVKYPDLMNVWDAVINSSRVNSEIQCANQCARISNCVGFGFRRANNVTNNMANCFLKSNIQSEHFNTSNQMIRHDSYNLNMITYQSDYTNRKFKCMKGVNMFSSRMTIYQGPIEQCQQRCNMLPGCVGFQYQDNIPNTCELNYYGRVRSTIPTTNLCIEELSMNPNIRSYDLHLNVSYGNVGILGERLVAYTSCPRACDSLPDCVGFTLNLEHGAFCWLLGSRVLNMRPVNRTAVTFLYNPNRSISSRNRTFFELKGIEYVGLDFMYADVPFENCRDECLKTTGCSAFQYNISNINNLRGCLFKYAPFGLPKRNNLTSTFITIDGGPVNEINSNQPPLYQFDKIVSLDSKSVLNIQSNGKLTLSYLSVTTFVYDYNVVFFKPHFDGTFYLSTLSNGDIFLGRQVRGCNNNAPGSWKLVVNNDMSVQVICVLNANLIGYSSELTYDDFDFWAFTYIMNSSNHTQRDKTDGKGVTIYYLDSGFSEGLDTADALPAINTISVSSDISNSNVDEKDFFAHGTLLTLITKSKFAGLAESANSVSVKITEPKTRFFSESSFVSAVAAAIRHNTTDSKIINFSGSFFNENSDVTNCAIQMAFSNKIAFIAAAGNDNYEIKKNNPYQLLVGSFNKPEDNSPIVIWRKSNFGNGVDIWAPNEFITKDKKGTSFATAFTSSVLAAAISKIPQLRNNPNIAYNYLIQNSKNVTGRRDIRKRVVVQSINTLVMPNFTKEFKQANYTDLSKSPNYCGSLGLTAESRSSLDRLITMASKTIYGGIVTSTSKFSCSRKFIRC